VIRFHVDEDQSQRIAHVARERFGLEVTASHELGMDRATDDEQLAFAGNAGRCIITRNVKDFEPLTRRFQLEAQPHAGVLVVPISMLGGEFFRIARALAYFASLYPDGVEPYFVSYLQDPPDDWEPGSRT
jgi:predicted nuclease of predicted toxin-antitoxin system